MKIEIRIDVDVDIEDIADMYFAYYEDTDENMDENTNRAINRAIEDYIINIYDSDMLELLIERNEYNKIVKEAKELIERRK